MFGRKERHARSTHGSPKRSRIKHTSRWQLSPSTATSSFSHPSNTREHRDYQKAGVTAIAAQQLFGSGVKLRPGQNIEYIITDSESAVPNDRVRAFALWEGWFGYDRKKYAAMLREAFEPFVLYLPKRAEPVLVADSVSEDDLKRFPLFSALPISHS